MARIRYLVNDVDEAISFYTQLGFNEKERWGPPFAILELWISGPETSAARPMPDGAQPVPGGWNRLVIQVSNIDETVTAMKSQGRKFRNEIIKGPGGKQILAEDPSGNPIELFEPGDE